MPPLIQPLPVRKYVSLLSALEAVGDLIARTCLIVAASCLFIIVGINAVNISARVFFNYAFSWAEEAEVFVMILSVFAAAVAASWRGAHMKMDMLVNRLPPTSQRAVVVLITLFSAGILLVLSTASYKVVSLLYMFGQTSASIDFPMWIPQGCVLVSFILMALLMVLRLAISLARPSDPPAEA
jgi:C4-dicarboxylate transporter DctQ subunit